MTPQHGCTRSFVPFPPPAGEAYETFHLPGTKDAKCPGMSEFCETEYRPYEQVVTATLIGAAVRGDVRVKCDGRWDNRAAGVALSEDEKIAVELDVDSMRPTPEVSRDVNDPRPDLP